MYPKYMSLFVLWYVRVANTHKRCAMSKSNSYCSKAIAEYSCQYTRTPCCSGLCIFKLFLSNPSDNEHFQPKILFTCCLFIIEVYLCHCVTLNGVVDTYCIKARCGKVKLQPHE